MTQEGQGTTPEQTPRPPTSTRWAEPGPVRATGPTPPFVPRSRPGTDPATEPIDPRVDTPTEAPEEPEWVPPYEAEAVEDVLEVEAADDVVETAGQAVAGIDDAARDTDDVARDTSDAVMESTEEPPALEYDISGPFAPLPRDQGGWIPEEEQEPLSYEAADEWDEPAAEEDVVVDEAVDVGADEYRDSVADHPVGDEAPSEAPDDSDDDVDLPSSAGYVFEPEPEPETEGITGSASGVAAYGEPDLVEELADRLNGLAARLRDEGADAARAEMDSYDRFTALVAGLVSGFLAGHGR